MSSESNNQPMSPGAYVSGLKAELTATQLELAEARERIEELEGELAIEARLSGYYEEEGMDEYGSLD